MANPDRFEVIAIDTYQNATGDDAFPLTIGSSGNNVMVLQKALNLLGSRLTVDGKYGSATQAAVVKNGTYGTSPVGVNQIDDSDMLQQIIDEAQANPVGLSAPVASASPLAPMLSFFSPSPAAKPGSTIGAKPGATPAAVPPSNLPFGMSKVALEITAFVVGVGVITLIAIAASGKKVSPKPVPYPPYV